MCFQKNKKLKLVSVHICNLVDSMNAHQSDQLEEVFNTRYKEVVKQKRTVEKEKRQIALKLVKIKEVVLNLKAENEGLRETFKSHYDNIKKEIDDRLFQITNKNRKSKKHLLSRPKVPDINLNIIFKEYILLLQNNTSDISSLGMRGEVQSERWALAIINLIYLDLTQKATEEIFNTNRPFITLQDFILQWF